MRRLFHELKMATGKDSQVIGEIEYNMQCNKHGGGRALTRWVHPISQVMMVLGFESSTPRGLAGMTVLDDDPTFESQPNHATTSA